MFDRRARRWRPAAAFVAVGSRTTRARLFAALIALVAPAVLAGGALGAEPTLVSVAGTGTSGGNGESGGAVVTPNGRHVAFESAADDLVLGDGNAARDVYVRDVSGGTTTLVSVNRFGTSSGAGASSAPAISDNGRWVAFVSAADDLVANDGNGVEDVFVRDLTSGVTSLVSVAQGGASSAAGAGGRPSISASGRHVAFVSPAPDLVTNDDNGTGDVFVRDVQNGTTILVSIDRQGASSADGESRAPVMTPSGRHVAFVSFANDLVPDDDGTYSDVFLRDLNRSTTTLVSISRAGVGGGNRDSYGPIVSPNGRHVAFTSSARDMVTGDRNQSPDVFVRDVRQETTTLASVSRSGKRTANGESRALALTPNGRYVLFSSTAPNLAAGDRNDVTDVFRRDLREGTTQLVSLNASGRVSGDGASDAAAMSADGRLVVFASAATNLLADPTSGAGDVFLRDVVAGVTSLVSARQTGVGGGNGPSGAPVITPDGRHAVFTSSASDLLAGDLNGVPDVFRRVVR